MDEYLIPVYSLGAGETLAQCVHEKTSAEAEVLSSRCRV